MGKTDITAEPGIPLIIITREFDAPRDLVFRAYTEPALVAQWLGPRDLTTIVDRYEVRDGGIWRFVHQDADGNTYGFHGVFHGTPAPDRMVQTFEFEGVPGHVKLDATTFEQRGERTLVRTVSSFESLQDRDGMVASGMERGVRDSGDRLDDLLASYGRDSQMAHARAGNPADVPAERPASLDRLEVLAGRWTMEASFAAGYFGGESPAITSRDGRTTFEWLEGKAFLIQRFVTEHPAAPSGIAIIGPGDQPETFAQHYYDSRGVARLYQASLDGGVWKLWREAPGFCQRYAGEVSDDGAIIKGAWEWSPDGHQWRHDFSLNYIKLDPVQQ